MSFIYDDPSPPSADDFVAHLPRGLSSARALLEALNTQLSLPSYFGFNWDALSDCLRDLSWIDQVRVVLCHKELPPLPAADLRSYLEVLVEATESWRPGEAHRVVATFPSSARARITALSRH